jgi:hypothetical protein
MAHRLVTPAGVGLDLRSKISERKGKLEMIRSSSPEKVEGDG